MMVLALFVLFGDLWLLAVGSLIVLVLFNVLLLCLLGSVRHYVKWLWKKELVALLFVVYYACFILQYFVYSSSWCHWSILRLAPVSSD